MFVVFVVWVCLFCVFVFVCLWFIVFVCMCVLCLIRVWFVRDSGCDVVWFAFFVLHVLFVCVFV